MNLTNSTFLEILSDGKKWTKDSMILEHYRLVIRKRRPPLTPEAIHFYNRIDPEWRVIFWSLADKGLVTYGVWKGGSSKGQHFVKISASGRKYLKERSKK